MHRATSHHNTNRSLHMTNGGVWGVLLLDDLALGLLER